MPSFNPKAFQEFMEQEIRLAMQQGQTVNNGITRAAIAKARANRITDYLYRGFNPKGQVLTEISQEEIDRISHELLNKPEPGDLRQV